MSLLIPLLLFAASLAAGPVSGTEVTECELTTGRTLTVIKSSGFPARYGSNVDCTYTVRRRSRSVCSVTFLFNVMDLEQSSNCSKDFLLLESEKMCGSKPIGFSRTIKFSEEDRVIMAFHSDNETQGLGYMVTVVQQECTLPSCDSLFDQPEFQLSSPNYPLPYDNGRTCTYTIQKFHPSVCRLQMKVQAFDVEDDPNCQSDFFLVNGDRMCGVLNEGQILNVDFPNSTLTMEFQSDHITTRDGFHFNVQQEICDATSETPEFTTQAIRTDTLETSTDVNISISALITD